MNKNKALLVAVICFAIPLTALVVLFYLLVLGPLKDAPPSILRGPLFKVDRSVSKRIENDHKNEPKECVKSNAERVIENYARVKSDQDNASLFTIDSDHKPKHTCYPSESNHIAQIPIDIVQSLIGTLDYYPANDSASLTLYMWWIWCYKLEVDELRDRLAGHDLLGCTTGELLEELSVVLSKTKEPKYSVGYEIRRDFIKTEPPELDLEECRKLFSGPFVVGHLCEKGDEFKESHISAIAYVYLSPSAAFPSVPYEKQIVLHNMIKDMKDLEFRAPLLRAQLMEFLRKEPFKTTLTDILARAKQAFTEVEAQAIENELCVILALTKLDLSSQVSFELCSAEPSIDTFVNLYSECRDLTGLSQISFDLTLEESKALKNELIRLLTVRSYTQVQLLNALKDAFGVDVFVNPTGTVRTLYLGRVPEQQFTALGYELQISMDSIDNQSCFFLESRRYCTLEDSSTDDSIEEIREELHVALDQVQIGRESAETDGSAVEHPSTTNETISGIQYFIALFRALSAILRVKRLSVADKRAILSHLCDLQLLISNKGQFPDESVAVIVSDAKSLLERLRR